MARCGDDLFEQVAQRQGYRCGIDAGVAGVAVSRGEVAVDNQPHAVRLVVNQPKGRDRSGGDMEQLRHRFGRCEREACTAELRREVFGFEGIVGRNHQQKEERLLLIGEKEVFENGRTYCFADRPPPS